MVIVPNVTVLNRSVGRAVPIRYADRSGRERVFSLDAKRLDIARQYLDRVAAQWDAAAARLKAFVERED